MSVIQKLRSQVAAARNSKPNHSAIAAFPPADPRMIEFAEAQLGFELPPLLKTIYLEVGNGGAALGPGLLGLPGGYDSEHNQDIVTCSLEMSSFLGWWDEFIVICDRGCSMCSCIDCTDEDFSVYRWDGNAFRAELHTDDPSDDVWDLEANTFEEWILQEITSGPS